MPLVCEACRIAVAEGETRCRRCLRKSTLIDPTEWRPTASAAAKRASIPIGGVILMGLISGGFAVARDMNARRGPNIHIVENPLKDLPTFPTAPVATGAPDAGTR
jgi:hypothetical protein